MIKQLTNCPVCKGNGKCPICDGAGMGPTAPGTPPKK